MNIGLDISVLSDKQKTGIAVYTYNLIENLLKINNTDKFILFGISTLDTYDYLKNISFKKYPNVEMKVFRMPSKAFRSIFLAWQKINWPVIENFTGNLDIFTSFNWYLPPQKKGKRVGVIYDLTSLTHLKFHQSKTSQLDKIRLERLAKEADLIIAISENSKKDFQKIWPQTRVEVIYPGVSNIFATKFNQEKTKQILKKYSLLKDFILSVSTLEPRKNLDRLIEGYLKSGLKRQLVLVGGRGWNNQQLLELVNKHKDKIKLTGFVSNEELAVLYKNAACLIYPSFYEGFGIPVLEAMKSGTPVICSDTSSLPEVGGDAVLYINPESEEEIIDALIKIEKEGLRKNLIKKGLQQAEKFSWEESAKKLNLLFQQL